MSANHDRNVREAMELAEKLPPFEAEIIKRLCRSSRQSKVLNQRANKEYRKLYEASKQVAGETRKDCAAIANRICQQNGLWAAGSAIQAAILNGDKK